MADGSERLPWLDEPRSRPGAPAPARRRGGAGWAWGAALGAILFVGAGAYWLGTRGEDRVPAPAAQVAERAPPPQVAPIPLDEPLPPPPESDNQVQAELAEADALPTPPGLQRSRAVVREIRESIAAREAREDAAAAEAERKEGQAATDAVGPDFGEIAAPVAGPVPVIVRTPGQSWGRKIQLGAFRTPALADLAWRGLVRRYPYLASKPKLVAGIDVRSTDGKATRMYRLQLAAASQAQAVVICQQLQRAGQSCVVVY